MDASVANFVDVKVQEAIKKSQNELLSNLDTLMKARFDQFGKQVSENQRELSGIQLAQLKAPGTDIHKFKRQGNEEQFKHNNKVLETITEAKFHLDNDTNDAKGKAIAKLSEGMETILHRQKLIKLADSSDLGWKLVNEYETHQLAEDSEDEKRIFKAEARAQKKVKQQLNSRRDRRFNPYQIHRSSTPGQSTSTRKPGLCFSCGRPGHWKADCGKVKVDSAPQDVTKISTNVITSMQMDGLNFGHSQNESHDIVTLHTHTTGRITASTHDILDADNKHNGSAVAELIVCDTSSIVQPSMVQTVDAPGVSPIGSLRRNIQFWEQVGAPVYILKVIKEGYRLPFLSIPNPIFLSNNKSALENKNFVSSEISKLLNLGCISKSSIRPEVVNPLTVAFNRAGKPRLVLDCRHINAFLAKFNFRLEDSSVARLMFGTGDFVFNFDLKSAYHHIEICSDFRTYLGFSWETEGQAQFFVFNVLPFGISTAAYIFTKVTRVLTKYWRSHGFKILMYLDDGLGGARGYHNALSLSNIVEQDLLQFGFIIAQEKCAWEPSSQTTWLGLVWGIKAGMVMVSSERIMRFLHTLAIVEQEVSERNGFVKARKLASLLGQIQSMHGAIGHLVRLRSRYLYACLQYKASWNSSVPVDQNAKNEMIFWKENVNRVNGQDLVGSHEYTGTVYTDASGSGYGGYTVGIEGSEVVGSWSDIESDMCSTWRELEALNRFCKSSELHTAGLVTEISERVAESGIPQDDVTKDLTVKMAGYLMKSRADNTVHKYIGYFNKWKLFAEQIGCSSLPACSIHVALYLTQLMDTGSSTSVVTSVKYSIKWVHDIYGHSDPTNNSFVNNLVESSNRIIHSRVVKKEAISVETLKTLCDTYSASVDLAVIRDLAMILLCFSGFLRFDELSSLRCNDISFHADHFTVKLRKSKTDQYRQGDEIVIAKGSSTACPYLMLQRYIHIAGLNITDDAYLFRPMFRSGSTCKLIYKSKQLSYTRARECIVSRLREVVGNKNIGLHSLRAGGATAAANASVNERCWKRHGRWRSDAAKDGYVADSLSSRLQVTRELHL